MIQRKWQAADNQIWFTVIGLCCLYFVVWGVPRYEAIGNNVLLFDDFYIGVNSEQLKIQTDHAEHFRNFRPMQFYHHELWENFAPGFFMGVLPKYLSGIYLAIAAVGFFVFLRTLYVGRITSVFIPALLLAHPLLSSISLWNTTFGINLGIAAAVWGIVALLSKNRVCAAVGFILCVFAVFTYQLLFAVLVCLWVLLFIVGLNESDQVGRRDVVRVLLLLGVVALVYTTYMMMAKYSMANYDERGEWQSELFFDSSIWWNKIKAITNNVANVFMPIMSYHLGVRIAWKYWEIIWLSVTVVTLLAYITNVGFKKGLQRAGPVLLLPVVPGVLLMVMTSLEGAESWRLSVPSLFAVMVGLVPLLHYMEERRYLRIPLIVALVSMVAILVPVTQEEAGVRVESNRLDGELVEAIRVFWSDRGVGRDGYGVYVIDANIAGNGLEDNERVVTRSYAPIRPLTYSALSTDFSWRGYLVFKGHSIAEDEQIDGTAGREFCAGPAGEQQEQTGRWVEHHVEKRLSVICA